MPIWRCTAGSGHRDHAPGTGTLFDRGRVEASAFGHTGQFLRGSAWTERNSKLICNPLNLLWEIREDWLRGVDLNHRPLGYEPNELPDCSTPHLYPTSTGAVRSNPQ